MKLITLTAALAMQTKIKCHRKTAQRMRVLISSYWQHLDDEDVSNKPYRK